MEKNPSAMFFGKRVASPVGLLTLVASEAELVAILWEKERDGRVPLGTLHDGEDVPVLMEAARQLGEYFAGQRNRFDVPIRFRGTAFQQKVWCALLEIPFGETRTYSEIASRIGSPRAVRAVGAANGRNPISIIAPCHRVIGASGDLTGFAGGIDAKKTLLALEGASWGAAKPAAGQRSLWSGS
ncbi:methylated-DNA--[protein]-cysteine S-methyltransferase [Burkholderia perseverans]|uniref:methylated-DNA--[protein]-cysteine S-methyltransferase n=1 Tax=Burkholderia perseverans TaxID=2615214 RepID=UPI003140A630